MLVLPGIITAKNLLVQTQERAYINATHKRIAWRRSRGHVSTHKSRSSTAPISRIELAIQNQYIIVINKTVVGLDGSLLDTPWCGVHSAGACFSNSTLGEGGIRLCQAGLFTNNGWLLAAARDIAGHDIGHPHAALPFCEPVLNKSANTGATPQARTAGSKKISARAIHAGNNEVDGSWALGFCCRCHPLLSEFVHGNFQEPFCWCF